MPQIEVDGLTINYHVQGERQPLLLIPLHGGWRRVLRLPAPGLPVVLHARDVRRPPGGREHAVEFAREPAQPLGRVSRRRPMPSSRPRSWAGSTLRP